MRPATPRPLDLSTPGPSVAMQAARATQAATARPGSAPAAPAVAAATVETMTSTPAGSVAGLTVRPEVAQPGRVIASSDAAALTSPNFSAADAEDAPLATAIGDGAALGRQAVDNTPPLGGFLHNNPDLLGSQPTRGDVGVTQVF